MNNLLIFTKTVDKKSRSGFFISWIDEFAKHYDNVFVLCLEKGEYVFMNTNISVYSLYGDGFYTGNFFLKQIYRIYVFLKIQAYLLKIIPKTKNIFIHMMPVYAVAVGLMAKFFKSKILFWYTHKSVDYMLWVSQFFVDGFVTASRTSFRLNTRKPVWVTGHAIDTDLFFKPLEKSKFKKQINIISVSRITPSKKIDEIIKTVFELKNKFKEHTFKLKIVGAPALKKDWEYLENLRTMVVDKNMEDSVFFVGHKTQNELSELYSKSDIFINMSVTGSLDKAFLEASLSGNVVFSTNPAFSDILGKDYADVLLDKTAEGLFVKMVKIIKENDEDYILKIREYLQTVVVKKHSLPETIAAICQKFI